MSKKIPADLLSLDWLNVYYFILLKGYCQAQTKSSSTFLCNPLADQYFSMVSSFVPGLIKNFVPGKILSVLNASFDPISHTFTAVLFDLVFCLKIFDINCQNPSSTQYNLNCTWAYTNIILQCKLTQS